MINCQLAIEQRRKQPIHHDFTWLFTIDANHSANKLLGNNQIDKFAVKTYKATGLPGNMSNSCLPVVVSKANSLTWIPNSQRTRQSCLVKWTQISEGFRWVKASNTHQRQMSMASSSWRNSLSKDKKYLSFSCSVRWPFRPCRPIDKGWQLNGFFLLNGRALRSPFANQNKNKIMLFTGFGRLVSIKTLSRILNGWTKTVAYIS